jgi:hypothetical protein
MNQLFEDYLKDVFAKDYMGTDDDMPKAFEAWFSDLSANELNSYAKQFQGLWSQ